MRKIPLKMKIILFVLMMLFMLFYMVVFGSKNAAIGVMIVMAAFMGLGNDLSFKPELSFFKVASLLLILGIAAFLNNPLTIWACILTFLIVFATTFTSYHLFGSNVYLPFLMIYFMMVCIPVTLEMLPIRLLSLIFGAIFIVGLNIIVNRKKDYKLSKSTINGLIEEIDKAIDLKLDGKTVSVENFKTANGFYASLFNKSEFKYFPSSAHESTLNVVKAFQYIGVVISKSDLSDLELLYIRKVIGKIKEIDASNIFDGVEVKTKDMYLVLLNLEIIKNEINRDLGEDSIIPDIKISKSMIKPIIKRTLSFRSVKFTFAFKMALVLTFWEVLTLIFNLPFSKWLYFSSIPLMLPYINDIKSTAKKRLIGTFIGVFIFGILIVIRPHLALSNTAITVIIFVICMFGMVYYLNNKLVLTIFTSVLSVTVSLMYISPSMAMHLKLLWLLLAVVVVSIINFGFLPYSVEKESKINLKICYDLNKEFIGLIKKKCVGDNSSRKTTLVVLSNIVNGNIEITDENRELFYTQIKITDMCNFILTYMDIFEFSQDFKKFLINIIDNNVEIDDNLQIKEKSIAYSTSYVLELFKREKEIL